MKVSADCSSCGAPLRADDRFCSRCGATGIAATPQRVHVDDFQPTDGSLGRLADYAINHAKGLLALLAIGALIGAGLFFGHEDSVPENISSPGYKMVRQLKSTGAVDDFKAVSPESGWDAEYSLDDGDAHVRFRGRAMEFEVPRSESDLRNAIVSEAHSEGFSG